MLRKIFVSLFVFLFVVFNFYFVTAYTALSTVSSEDFLSADFFDSLQDVVVYELARSDEVRENFGDIEPELIEGIFNEFVQAEDIATVVYDLRDQINTVPIVDGLLSYNLDLSFLISRSDLVAENLAGYYYGVLPKCSELAEFTVYAVESLDSMECIPESLAQEDFAAAVQLYLDRELFSDFAEAFDFEYEVPNGVEGTMGGYLSFLMKMMFVFGVLFNLVLMLVVALLIFRPWQKIVLGELKAIFSAAMSLSLVFALVYIFPVEGSEMGAKALVYEELFAVTVLPIARNVLIISIPTLLFSFGAWMALKNIMNQNNLNDSS